MRFNFMTNKIYNMNNLHKTIILTALLLLLAISYYIYKSNTYITAEFNNLRPFHYHAPIYYNGFKIGRVIKVRPNKEYTASIVTMELHPNDLKLPTNITANLKKEKDRNDKKFDYIDIIMPEKPSGYYIKDGDKIAGKTTVELETFLANQDPDSLEAIKADFAETVKNLNVTVQTLGDLFATLNSMAQEVQPNIVKASSDLSYSTSNLVKVSKNIDTLTNNTNNALNEKRMNATAKNVQATSKNIKVMTGELNKSIPEIQCAINQINSVLYNVNEMTTGLNCTMKKRFGGFRLFFGTPISKKNCKCK